MASANLCLHQSEAPKQALSGRELAKVLLIFGDTIVGQRDI